MDKQKLQEVFSDKAYVESIAKMSAEDAAKSFCEKGVDVTADDLMKVHDFIIAHQEEPIRKKFRTANFRRKR